MCALEDWTMESADRLSCPVGDRVIGMTGHGGYASEAIVDQGSLLPMPKNMSYDDGAAFTMTYGTSYYALKQRSSYKPGETLLVTGASGGVGLTAVELGALMGLKVIAAVGSDEKMEICKKYGATMFVNYAKEKMRDKVKELTGGNGADIIYDAVGGDAFDESVRCIAWYGRLLVVGFAAGRITFGRSSLPISGPSRVPVLTSSPPSPNMKSR